MTINHLEQPDEVQRLAAMLREHVA